MTALLDTCAVLWAARQPERLSARVRALLLDSHTDVTVSVVSAWEMALKPAAVPLGQAITAWATVVPIHSRRLRAASRDASAAATGSGLQVAARRKLRSGYRQSMSHRKETILVVDDEPAVRRLTSLMLESAGYDVYSAASAAEAVELAERLACGLNLLLTDMQMPGVDGHELIGRIRRICPHMDVMVFSGFLGEDRPRNYPVLPKPFTREQLLAAVRAILDVQL